MERVLTADDQDAHEEEDGGHGEPGHAQRPVICASQTQSKRSRLTAGGRNANSRVGDRRPSHRRRRVGPTRTLGKVEKRKRKLQ